MYAVKRELGFLHFFRRECTERHINRIFGKVCCEFLIRTATLFGGFSCGIVQGAAKYAGADQREGNAVQAVTHKYTQRIVIGIE